MKRSITLKSNMILFCVLCWLLLGQAWQAEAQQLSAQAVVEQQEVFLGQSFIFQIQISGSDSPEAPNVEAIADFDVESLGGRSNNSQSVTVINGRMNRVIRRGYTFSYRLTPRRTGTLIIPPIRISAEGNTVNTQPISITVVKPQQTEDFKLDLSLSRSSCYLGEPVELTITWYIGKDIRDAQFNLPFLTNPAFTVADPQPQIDPNKNYFRIRLGSSEVIAQRNTGSLGNKSCTTLSFQKIIIPRKPGTFQLAQATVACNAMVGMRKTRNAFDDFFAEGFFGSDRRGIFKKYVVPSNTPSLEVLALPQEGKPNGFAGHVGPYRIDVSASPTEVCVGDPITLTIKVTGPEYLKDMELPPLKNQPALVAGFKIPQEREPGKIVGNAKLFTQTIRATRADIKEIPSIELPYFDTQEGRYQIARTEPIALTVKATKVLTIKDAEGREPIAIKSQLSQWHKGIAHNYEDLSILENQDYGLATLIKSPQWLAFGTVPPVIYFALLLATTLHRRSQADPDTRKAKKAYGQLTAALRHCQEKHQANTAKASSFILEALRNYLGSKLRIAPAALAYRDIEKQLQYRRINTEICETLEAIFQKLEAHSYAGATWSPEEFNILLQTTLNIAKRLQRSLK